MRESEPRALATMFALALVVVMMEVTLSRLFAGLVYDGLVYMSLALGMLGMAAGGSLESLVSDAETADQGELRVKALVERATGWSVAFAVLVVLINVGPGAALDDAIRAASRDEGVFAGSRLFILGRMPLALAYGAASIPLFVTLGRGIAALLRARADIVGRIYAVDLAGAALGALAGVLVLMHTTAVGYLLAPTVVLTAACALWGERRWPWLIPAVAVFAVTQVLGFPPLDTLTHRNVRKPDQVRVASEWTEVAYTQLIAKPRGGWRLMQDHHSAIAGVDYAPEQAGCWPRGERGRACDAGAWLHAADALRPGPRSALVLAAGVGRQILHGVHFGLERVVGVDMNPNLLPFVSRTRPTARVAELMARSDVEFVVDEARHYVRRTQERFDIVLVPAAGRPQQTVGPNTADHLLTEEAITDYVRRLKPGGLLCLSMGIMWHPDFPGVRARTVGLVERGLAAAGISDPSTHVVGYDPALLYISKRPFTSEELMRGALAVSGDGRIPTTWEAFKAGMDPEAAARRVTDDDPFWRAATSWGEMAASVAALGSPSIGRAGAQGTMALSHALALLGALVVLFLPLARRRQARVTLQRGDAWLLGMFAAIGLGFMCIELPLIEKLVFTLGHPARSLAYCLFVLLLWTGAGAWLAGQHLDRPDGPDWRRVRAAFIAIVGLSVGMWLGLEPLLQALAGMSAWFTLPVIALALGPLGLLLGVPFPMGMTALRVRGSHQLIPWAWAANGATSVLAVHLSLSATRVVGISPMFGVAAGCYVVAGLCLAMSLRTGATERAGRDGSVSHSTAGEHHA